MSSKDDVSSNCSPRRFNVPTATYSVLGEMMMIRYGGIWHTTADLLTESQIASLDTYVASDHSSHHLHQGSQKKNASRDLHSVSQIKNVV